LGTKFRVYSLQTPFLGSLLAKKIAWKTKVGKQWVNQTMDTYAKIDRTFIHSQGFYFSQFVIFGKKIPKKKNQIS
jgi:hypothetical protein